ncbi:MAG: class I SAM-dependent methyltransferase [Pseudomonadota bacterium]
MALGERFEFGANWAQFLNVLNDERIALAEQSLSTMLGVSDLQGKRFLDIGSGSGLFSLVARRLGATVHSFDYDPQSVACTAELKRRYHPDDPDWTVEQGSALDKDYLHTLGQWDIVYSWGVLHHTGAMWQALENVTPLVRPGGTLFVAIYNYQRGTTPVWTWVKRAYSRLPDGLRWLVLGPALIRLWGYHNLRSAARNTFPHLAALSRTQRAGNVRLARCGRLRRRPSFRSGQTRGNLPLLSRPGVRAGKHGDLRRWAGLQ